MKSKDFRAALEKADAAGIWAFHLPTLRLLTRAGSDNDLKSTLRRARADGLIERASKGVYFNPRARSIPTDALAALISFIRPFEFNYLSLETMAADYDLISQQPSVLTVMSTGPNHMFDTPLGRIEFVHTKRANAREEAGVTYDANRGVCVADREIVVRDLRRCGRATDLLRDPEE